MMTGNIFEQVVGAAVSRRTLLRAAGAGLVGGGLLPGSMIGPALAEDRPAIGTYPAGSSGSSVFIGISVPRTGTYALQGEDELKGYQLAIEHINSGHRADQEDIAEDHQGRARQGIEVRRRRLRAPSRTKRCRRSSASSARTRRC